MAVHNSKRKRSQRASWFGRSHVASVAETASQQTTGSLWYPSLLPSKFPTTQAPFCDHVNSPSVDQISNKSSSRDGSCSCMFTLDVQNKFGTNENVRRRRACRTCVNAICASQVVEYRKQPGSGAREPRDSSKLLRSKVLSLMSSKKTNNSNKNVPVKKLRFSQVLIRYYPCIIEDSHATCYSLGLGWRKRVEEDDVWYLDAYEQKRHENSTSDRKPIKIRGYSGGGWYESTLPRMPGELVNISKKVNYADCPVMVEPAKSLTSANNLVPLERLERLQWLRSRTGCTVSELFQAERARVLTGVMEWWSYYRDLLLIPSQSRPPSVRCESGYFSGMTLERIPRRKTCELNSLATIVEGAQANDMRQVIERNCSEGDGSERRRDVWANDPCFTRVLPVLEFEARHGHRLQLLDNGPMKLLPRDGNMDTAPYCIAVLVRRYLLN
jgi:hypothetical protein